MDQFIRGTVADEMGDYYRAVFHYQEALRWDSSSAFIYVALARDYILLGSLALAEETINRVLARHEDNRPALELKGVVLRGSSRLPEARDNARRLLQLAPDNLEYLRQLLALDLVLSDFDEAERIHARIVETGGDSPELSRRVLAAYLVNGQGERALALARRLIADDSTDAEMVYALGSAYLATRDTLNAVLWVSRAAQLKPAEPRYWLGWALLCSDGGREAEAVSIVDSALVNLPPHAGLLSTKGIALYRLGRRAEAVAALSQAISLDTTLFGTMGTLALVYDEMDSVARAAETYEKAIQASDSAAVFLNNLAYTYASRGIELDKARVLTERALLRDPGNGAYLDTMGWIEFGLGRYEEALRWLKKAIKQRTGGAEVFEHIGDTYMKLGSRAKALKYYRQALDADPANETLRQKLAE